MSSMTLAPHSRRMTFGAFCVFLLVLTLGFCNAQSDPSTPTYYAVDSTLAYTWTRGYPQACECAEGAVRKTECDMFRCSCICDVTAGQCDYNCCCDVDCSADQKSRFTELNACSTEGVEASDIEHCYSSSDVYGVNPREPMGGQPTAHEAVGQALCVVQKNTAIPELFYDVAEVVSSTVFTTSEGQKTYSYLQTNFPAVTPDDSYDQNDSISAFMISGDSGIVSNGPGFMQLPAPDFAGVCNDLNYATFENRVEAQSCARALSTDIDVFSAQCETQFSLSKYVTNLYIAQNSRVEASNGNAALSDTLGVTLSGVYFEDYLTGSLTEVTSSWGDCRTRAFSGEPSLDEAGTAVNSTCSFSSANTLSELMAGRALCQGFVKAVYYTVNHTAAAEAGLISVSATVTLSDVPIADLPTSSNATTATAVTITQTFAVEFASAVLTDVNADNGNIVKRYRSGNPGYLLGMPVLYADLSGTVMAELVDGFTVPSAIAPYDINNPETFGRSVCPSASSYSSTSGVSAGSTQVQFGYDLTSGCSVQLNRSALIALCCAGSGSSSCGGLSGVSPYSDATTGIPYFYEFTSRHVGIYGDADPLDVDQWSLISYAVPSDARGWSEKTSTCSGMYNGMEIQFLVAATGSKSNPQNKIISSSAQVTTGDWVMTLPPNDAHSTQNFPMTITVSFVFQNEEDSRNYIVPAPPVLFKVPFDVFYPFLNSAPPRYAQTVMLFGSLSVSVSLVVSIVCATLLLM